jgi:fructan beta-fructosidase
MPFNQQFGFPCELMLRTFPEGIRLCRNPVKELDILRSKELSLHDKAVGIDENPLAGMKGDTFEIITEIESNGAEEVGFDLGDLIVKYFFTDEMLVFHQSKNRHYNQLAKPLKPIGGQIKLQLLVDRTSIEIFGNDGRISISACYVHEQRDENLNTPVRFYSSGGNALIKTLQFNKLNSIWN